MARVLRLPDHGTLLVCTDLQGCMRDFQRVVELFEAEQERSGDAVLLITGDLVHGPHIDPEDWPDFLGEYYRDESGELIDEFIALRNRFPHRVHALLGNHEHGHIGGPHTAKFAVDEVALLEHILGLDRTRRLRAVISELPLVALAPCGAVFTHGAPAADIEGIEEIEAASLHEYEADSPLDIFDVPVIGPLLWARSAPPEVARRFLRAVGGRISIYGHDVIPEGFEAIGDEQIIVSTSFGVYDANKVYLRLDLGGHYTSVRELRPDHEILPLYPDKAAARGRQAGGG